MNRVHLALAVGLIAVLGMVLTPLLSDPPGLQTSYSYSPSGSRAFRVLVDEFDGRVRAWHSVPKRLHGSGNLLLMLEPNPGLLVAQAQYRQDILNWVAAGNHLLIVPATYQAAVTTIMKRDIEIATPLERDEEGVARLFEDAGLDLTMSYIPVSLELDALETAQEASFELELGGQKTEFAVLGSACRKFVDFDGEFTVEGRLDGEPVMLGAEWGAGGLHVLTLPQLFRNRSLAYADHAGAVLAVCGSFEGSTLFAGGASSGGESSGRRSFNPESSGRSELFIDEFFHGLPAMTGFLDLVVRPPFHFFALQLLIFITLLLWAMLPRPVPIREQRMPSRRSKAEHLDAMGRLLANGSEGPLVVQRLREGLKEDLQRAYYLNRELNDLEMVDYLRRFDPEIANQYRDILKHCNELLAHPRIADSSLLSWGRRVAKLRNEVKRSRTQNQTANTSS